MKSKNKNIELAIPSDGEEVKQLEHSGIAGVKWPLILAKSLTAPYKAKPTLTTWSSNPTPKYLT